MGSTKWVQVESALTGKHTTTPTSEITTEWNPTDKSAQEFRDMVLRELNALKNKTPDFDSGYMLVEVDNTYRVEHPDLGGVPNIVQVYHSSVAEPRGDQTVRLVPSITTIDLGNTTAVLSGVQVNHYADGSATSITVARDSLLMHSGQTTGYIRLLLWR
jgi:hypothetical protein